MPKDLTCPICGVHIRVCRVDAKTCGAPACRKAFQRKAKKEKAPEQGAVLVTDKRCAGSEWSFAMEFQLPGLRLTMLQTRHRQSLVLPPSALHCVG